MGADELVVTQEEAGSRVDPVTLEIISGALEAAILEMEALIDHTAMSALIKEKKDRFVGFYDATGRMITAHLALTGQGLITAVLKEYPIEEMSPGDLYWYNDPYFSGGAIQHLGDMCFITPVFAEGRVIAFSTTFGHFRDLGGSKPESISPAATEIFQEGVRVPPIRIAKAGQFNREAYRIVLANSRFPVELEGDSRALMAGSRLGETRLMELVDRYGTETLLAGFDLLIENTRRTARARLREFVPEGRYRFYDYIDSDGHTNEPIRVGMELIREGDEITVDVSESGPQTRGPVNFITTLGFINLLFGRYLASEDLGLVLNEGLFGVIDHLKVKPGTVVQPIFPAATGLRTHSRVRLSSCMLGIMGQATGGQSPANSPVYVIYALVLRDPRTGALDVCSEGVGAGLGARPNGDGVDVIYFVAQQNFPIEFIEREHLVRIEAYQIQPDSGGPGYFRGGCGVRRDVRVLADGVLRTRMDNTRFPCWGGNGGVAGRAGGFFLNGGTARERSLPTIGDDLRVEAGDLVRIITAGGGGWGDPFTRPALRVLEDVKRHFVTVEGALRDYGVAIEPDTMELDEEKTLWLRAQPRPPRPKFDRGDATEWLRSRGELLV